MNFESKAHCYDSHAQVQKDLADWLAGWLPENMEGKSALELGAGIGTFTRYIVTRNASIDATDVFLSMIGEGQRRVPKAKWYMLNAWNPDIKGNYDYLFSSALLQWADDPEAVLNKWRQLVPANGRLISGILIEGSLCKLNEILPRHIRFAWRTDGEWHTLITNAGWKINRIETETRPYRYENALSVLRSLHGLGAVNTNQFSPAQVRELISEYDHRHLNNGELIENWCFLRVEATPL